MKILQQRPIYWECTIDGHRKFWAAQIMDTKDSHGNITKCILIRKWGMIGTEGQKMEQEYNNIYDAEVVLEKLIREKQSNGYKPIF